MLKAHLGAALALSSIACSTTSADTMIDADPERESALAAQAAADAAHTEAATAQAMVLVEGASAYMRSEQSFHRDQPWHRIKVFGIGSPHSGKDGMPVESKEYVFPGGPSFSFSSHEQVPVAGKPSVERRESIDDITLKALFKLGYAFSTESDLRVSYNTGPGEGVAATAVVVVETDMDPDTPQNHTVTYTLSLDDVSQEIIVAQPIVTHAMK